MIHFPLELQMLINPDSGWNVAFYSNFVRYFDKEHDLEVEKRVALRILDRLRLPRSRTPLWDYYTIGEVEMRTQYLVLNVQPWTPPSEEVAEQLWEYYEVHDHEYTFPGIECDV
ncbi:hypothetical protein BDY19DRAFT_1058050 [Irpex rosettiformis]|uniref:Uncharacterized protein n=1 Tax=Irpex rosettiformis TaxID=378272 RepID=A0ACB8TZX0_9APHY|nr:hypothetical protein BDY19DRAFT_1058050 [Irpex rosettiformis]